MIFSPQTYHLVRRAALGAGVLFLAYAVGTLSPSPEVQPSQPKTERVPQTEIFADELAEMMKAGQVVIFDARPLIDYNDGHIAGALNLPAWDFLNGYARWKGILTDPDRTIVVYCTDRGCHRSDAVIEKLRERGHRRVLKLAGGWDTWVEAGLPQARRS